MPRIPFSLALVALAGALSAHVACSGSSDGTPQGTPDAASTDDGAPSADAPPVPTDDGAPSPDAPAPTPQQVTFTYAPHWSGVTAVTVLGAFGQSTDWTQPFATLTADASGVFHATAMLPLGQYLYVYKVTGDAAAAMPATYPRYSIDPRVAAFAACPSGSPTYSMVDANPCSQLTVPQGAPDPTSHATGTVLVDGAPAAGYLVVLERDETGSHHYFGDRVTTAADGTFDLGAAHGQWRLQVWHPTYLSKNDLDRDPLTLNALRRTISASFSLATDVAVPSPELGYHAYGSFAPTGDAGALPTTFAFGGDAGAPMRLDVYEGKTGEIGDPWYASAATASGSATFDGGFNTKQATEPAVKNGERYFWGTEQADGAKTDGGVAWTGQTMVFPVTWP